MRFVSQIVAATAVALALSTGLPSTASAQPVVEEVVVAVQPPPRRVEVQYAAPGAEYVWHRGDWVFNPEVRNFVWHPGHWVMRPDAAHSIWFPGEWISFAGSWRYVPGHWRTAAEGPAPDYVRLVEVVKEPPPPPAEIVPVLQPGYEWDRGHWSWDGNGYRWVRGHWLSIPREYHHWQSGHWYRSGNLWFFQNGYWH